MIDISLRQRLETCLDTEISDEFLFEATRMLLRILFCLDNATLLPKFFVKRGYFDLARDTKELKQALLNSGYTLRNCKFFVNALAIKKATVEDYEQYEIHSDDAQLLHDAASHGKVFTYCRMQAKDFPYVSMEKFSKALEQEIAAPKMVSFMGKFINKKLRWVMNSQGSKLNDLQLEFIQHAIVRVYRTYPRIENRVHLRNLMRQVIHARGQSIIIETKKSKRNNLIKNDKGEFTGRLAPFHLIPQELLDSNVDNLSCSMTGGDKSAENNWIFQQDLENTIREHRFNETQKKFLNAVFRSDTDPIFVSYLRVNVAEIDTIPEDELSDFLMEHRPEELVTQAIEYAALNPNEAVALLRTVKERCM